MPLTSTHCTIYTPFPTRHRNTYLERTPYKLTVVGTSILKQVAPGLSNSICDQLTMSPWNPQKLLMPNNALVEWLASGATAISSAGADDHMRVLLSPVRAATVQLIGLGSSGLKELNLDCDGWISLPGVRLPLMSTASAEQDSRNMEAVHDAPDDWETLSAFDDDNDNSQKAVESPPTEPSLPAKVLEVLACCGLSINNTDGASSDVLSDHQGSLPAFAVEVSVELLRLFGAAPNHGSGPSTLHLRNNNSTLPNSRQSSCRIFYTLAHVTLLMFALSCSMNGDVCQGLKLSELPELLDLALGWLQSKEDGLVFGMANYNS